MDETPCKSRYQALIDILPKDNLLRLCYTYTKEHSAACDSFAFAASLGFISALISPFVRIQTKNNREEQTNLFICILGDSTVSGKSDAIRPLLKSGLLKEASSKIEDFVLVSGNIQDTVQGTVESLLDRINSQGPGDDGIDFDFSALFQDKTISLVTISTEAGPYFNSTGADKSNARGKEVSAFHRDAYDTDTIDIPLTKAARNRIKFNLDSIRATCTILLGLTMDEFNEVKGNTSASCGQLPRFMFVGVDGSFKGLPYVDYSETRMTVNREEILMAVEKFASGLNDCPQIVRFNADSPIVQELNKTFVEARDLTADVSDTVRRATIRGVVNLYRVAGLIAGCELKDSVSDDVLTTLKDIFDGEIIPFSVEAQSEDSELEQKIIKSIEWYHHDNCQDPTKWEIRQKFSVRSNKDYVAALTALIQAGRVTCYKGDAKNRESIEVYEKPVYGARYVLTDWLKDNEERAK